MSVIEEVPLPGPRPQPIPVRIGAPRAGPPRAVVLRKDPWWAQPLITGLGLAAFVVYANMGGVPQRALFRRPRPGA